MTNTKIKILKPSTLSIEHQSTQSAALIGSNDDLLTEILLRLPAASILGFKSVSKHWHWLLSDRSFTVRFDKLSKSPGIFACLKYVPFDVEDRSTLPPFSDLDFPFDPHGIEIVRSCNGLMLCMSGDGVKKIRYREDKDYVLNPTTKQFAIIPKVPGGRAVNKTIVSMCLAFHQTDCVHYKVVCICELDYDKGLYQIQVYSSDTREWKISIESFSPSTSMPTWGIGVYWNGAMHWANCPLYYEVDAEELHSMPLQPSKPYSRIYLGESGGHLHLVMNKCGKFLHLNVYEMLSDHSAWSVKYQLELDEIPPAFLGMITCLGSFGYAYGVVDMVRGENDEDTFLILFIHPKLIKYNIHDKSFKLIFVLPGEAYYMLRSFHRYIEALASI